MAGRKPKGEIMSETAMIEAGKQKRSTSRLYKAESQQISNEAIQKSVIRGYYELENASLGKKIDLSNVDMVKEVSLQYIHACADAECFPTMSGLALAMGVSRRVLDYWISKKPDTETGQWLSLCHDLYSDVLAEASLKNNCNPIVGIFLQKAIYGLRENIALEVNQIQDDDFEGARDYKEKYLKLIDRYNDLIPE